MSKALITILLLLFIAVSFSFAGLKLAAQGPDDSWFNAKWRSVFAAQPVFRKMLALHYDGDARADYLGDKYKKILIEVDAMQDISAYYEALELLQRRIQGITGKETTYIISDKNIPYERAADDVITSRVVEKYRSRFAAGETASLYVLYASRHAEKPELLGSTHEEYGLVLYTDALEDFVGSNLDIRPDYEASTLLHEFGHQLGLPHNDEEGCLMNESADQGIALREDPEDVIMDFCEYEKSQISNF